jgi:hypothetical protein
MQFFEHRIRSVRAAAAAFNAWIDRYRAAIDMLHYGASLALVFGTAAYATYHCALAQAARQGCGAICLPMPGFYYLAAAACGALAILTVQAYGALRRVVGLRPEFQKVDVVFIFMTSVISQLHFLLGAPGYGRSEIFFCGLCYGGFGVLRLFRSRPPTGHVGGLEPNGSA